MAEKRHSHSKRRRISSQDFTKPEPNWFELPTELMELILNKLPHIDIIRLKSVSSSWCTVAQSHISNPSYTPCPQTPWLMLPSDQEDDLSSRSFFSLSEKKVYNIKNMFEGLGDAWCVGSSQGWLVVLDEKANPHLFNPLSGVQIELPLFPSEFKPRVDDSYFVEQLRKLFIAKAVLLADPSRCNKYAVVVIYGNNPSRLAFFKNGDKKWTDLGGEHFAYCDIICHNDQLYALADNGSVEAWDFQSPLPTKIMNIEPAAPIEDAGSRKFPREKFSTQFYLVESSGDLLFIKRFIGNFVNPEGVAVDEADLLNTEDTQPLVCPYRTMLFRAYKLDFSLKKWEKVKSLHNQVLFLGGNQSMSLSTLDFPECVPNSIYFTDDRWEEVNEDYLYGGHDLGIFNFQDECVTPFYHCDLGKIDPPPFWITPSPW